MRPKAAILLALLTAVPVTPAGDLSRLEAELSWASGMVEFLEDMRSKESEVRNEKNKLLLLLRDFEPVVPTSPRVDMYRYDLKRLSGRHGVELRIAGESTVSHETYLEHVFECVLEGDPDAVTRFVEGLMQQARLTSHGEPIPSDPVTRVRVSTYSVPAGPDPGLRECSVPEVPSPTEAQREQTVTLQQLCEEINSSVELRREFHEYGLMKKHLRAKLALAEKVRPGATGPRPKE